jgi:sec-independent protein translocase protein TatA
MRLGFGEIVIILIIALLIFGPKKLPQLGEALGKGIRNFKKSAEGHDDEPAPKETPASELPAHAQGTAAPASQQTVTNEREPS